MKEITRTRVEKKERIQFNIYYFLNEFEIML